MLKKEPSIELTARQLSERVERSGFDEPIYYQPEVVCKSIFSFAGTDSELFLHFHWGQKFHTAITESGNIYCWPVNFFRKGAIAKSVKPEKQLDVADHRFLSGGILKKLTTFANSRNNKFDKITKIFGNREGDLILLSSINSSALFFASNNEISSILRNFNIAVSSVAFIENKAPQWTFMIGCHSGQFIYIRVEKDRSLTDPYERELHIFRSKGKPLPVHAIALINNGSGKEVFLAVGRQVLQLKNVRDFSHLSTHFDHYLKNAVLFYDSITNFKFYVLESTNTTNVSFFFASAGSIVILRTSINSSPFKKEKTALDTVGKGFYPWNLHYALIGEETIVVCSHIYNQIIFGYRYPRAIQSHAMRPGQGSLLILDGKELYEVKILNEEHNLWLHYLALGLHDQAYSCAKEHNSNMIKVVSKAWAEKLYHENATSAALTCFFEADESFESLFYRHLLLAPCNFRLHNLIEICEVFSLRIQEAKNFAEFGLHAFFLATLCLEICNYGLTRSQRLSILKNEASSLHINVEVAPDVLTFFQLKINNCLRFIKSETYQEGFSIIRDIFISYGSFTYLEKTPITSETYFVLALTTYATRNYDASASYLITFFKDIFKKETKATSRHLQALSDFGPTYIRECPRNWEGFCREVCKKQILFAQSEELLPQLLRFVSSLPALAAYKTLLKYLMDFAFELIKWKPPFELKAKKAQLENTISQNVLVGLLNCEMYEEVSSYIYFFCDYPTIFSDLYPIWDLFYTTLRRNTSPLIERAHIHALGLKGLHAAAVDKSVQQNEPELAVLWASKPVKLRVRRKLWLRILLSHMQNPKLLNFFLAQKECAVNVSELLDYVGPNFPISLLQENIKASLRDYSNEINSQEDQLLRLQALSENLQRQSAELKQKAFIIEENRRCDICNLAFTSDFIFCFPCRHVFHQHCLIGYLSRAEFSLVKSQLSGPHLISASQHLWDKNLDKKDLKSAKISSSVNLLPSCETNDVEKMLETCSFCDIEIVEWAFSSLSEEKSLFWLK